MLLLIAFTAYSAVAIVIGIIAVLAVGLLKMSSTEAEMAREDNCFFCPSDDVDRRVDGHGACMDCYRTHL